MATDLPGANFIEDNRLTVVGDSFTWEGTEPLANKKALIIHHSGTNSATAHEDGASIANFHVNSRGWGGIGYHFVIRHDSHPKGAGIEYVGDLGSWRAHILNQNPGKVGIVLCGNFLQELPGPNQLRLARQLIDFLLAPNNILLSINYYTQVYGHGLYPNQQTAGEQCPGFQGHGFGDWFAYLQGRDFPTALYPQAPTPPPPVDTVTPPAAPIPVVVPVTEPQEPEWVQTWTPIDPTITKSVTQPDAYAVDATGAGNPIPVPVGTSVEIAGTFQDNGKHFYRTVYSQQHSTWYGVEIDYFSTPGQPANATIPVTVTQSETILDDTPASVGNPTDVSIPIITSDPATASLPVLFGRFLAALLSPLLRLFNKNKGA